MSALNLSLMAGASLALVSAFALTSNGVSLAHAAPSILRLFADRPVSPEPASWAMLMMGFGSAGALLRRRGRLYRLVEALPDGGERSEEFDAPDDATALARACAVAEGHIELWRGEVRIAPRLNS